MRRILVTGAAGYIGRNLCTHLLKNGYEVTGSLLNQEEAQLLPGEVKPVCTGRINGETDWTQALQGVDGVVHLAAIVHKKETKDKETENLFRRTNTEATVALAEQALTMGVRSFVFLSTVAVYGVNKTTKPLTVNSPINPTTYYGQSKWEAEQKLTARFTTADSSLTILRPTMVYGPQAPGNFARLSKLVKIGVPLPFGNLKNKRHFLFINRLVEYITVALENLQPGVKIQIAADKKTLSTKELILLAVKWENRTSFIFPFPLNLLQYLFALCGKQDEWEKIGTDFEIRND